MSAPRPIHAILRALAESGVGVIVISSELPELIGLCERLLVISEGRLAGELGGDDITETAIMTLAARGASAAVVFIILTLVVVLSVASPHFPTWTNMRAHGDGALGRGDRRRRHDDPPDLGRDP